MSALFSNVLSFSLRNNALTLRTPTLSVSNDPSASAGQQIALSNLVTISDPDSVGYTQLELWDTDGNVGGGQFKINGISQTGGHEIDASPADVAHTVFDAGTLGGTDTLWARLLQSNGQPTTWQSFTVTVPVPALSASSVANATRGQAINLSSLVTISDPGNVGYSQLELWDSNGTVGSGQFVVNGVHQTGGHEIDVSPADVSNTVFDVGTLGGPDTLWARLLQSNGQPTAWQSFTVTAPTARPPTFAVNSDPNATAAQTINLANLVAISDPDGAGFAQLELWDLQGTAGGGQFLVNGAPQTGGHEIDVAPADVANTVFRAGTMGGTDTLWARLLESNGQLTGWQQLIVTVPLPTLSVSGVANATRGQAINLSSLVTISDPGNVGYSQLELWDSNGTVAGGQFKISGISQTGGHEIDVSPANVANTVFDAGTLGGTDTLWARLLQSNGQPTTWQSFTVAVPLPALSPSSVANATRGQAINLSSLITISDPGNLGYGQLELWDSNGTVGGGQFLVNGVHQTGGHEIDVSPADVSNTVFDVGTLGGTDTLWARLLQSNGQPTAWQSFTVTAPTARPPTLAVNSDPNATAGQTINLANLVAISDPDGAGFAQLELWDLQGTAGGGQFLVNGAAQTGGHEIDVAPADVANTVFRAGTLGGTDTLWARLLESNGQLTGWQQLTVMVPPPILSVNNIGNATPGQTISLANLVTVSDPGNVGYSELQLWDQHGTAAGGQFMVNGVSEGGGQEIDVSPADIANTVFDVGMLGGTDTLWARLLQSNGQPTAWQQFTVTAPTDTGPVVTVSNISAMAHQVFAVSSLFTASDALGDPITQYDFWNRGIGGGHFSGSTPTLPTNQDNIVSAAQLGQTTYDSGDGVDTLWVRAYEGGEWGPWSRGFTVGPAGFTVQLNDPNHLPQDAALLADMNAAASDWWQHLNALGTIDIQINVQSTTRASGGPGIVVAAGTDGARTVYEAGSLSELLTGNDPNGPSPDVVITVDPTYLQNELWLDPNPSQPSVIPANRTDGLSVLRHELGHGFGITTYRDPSTGALPAGYEMTWDKFVQIHADGSAWFTGPSAEAVYGGPVPVTTLQNGEQYAHLGNSVNDADGQDLMNGVQFNRGESYQISALDLAILRDIGALTNGSVAAAGVGGVPAPAATPDSSGVALLASYMASAFAPSGDEAGGSSMFDPLANPTTEGPSLALPQQA